MLKITNCNNSSNPKVRRKWEFHRINGKCLVFWELTANLVETRESVE